jgi:hypothetical protein
VEYAILLFISVGFASSFKPGHDGGRVTVCLAVGDPLAEVETECENGLAFARRVHFGLVIELCGAQLALIRTLRGLTPTFGCLDYEEDNERLQFVYQKGIAYGFQMGLRPQTLYGIADSPVGLAAYFLDHDARSYELISRVFQGQAEGLTRDDIRKASDFEHTFSIVNASPRFEISNLLISSG